MTQRTSRLGGCPDCGTTLSSFRALVEYVTDEGASVVLAECPDCGDPARPE